MILRARAARQEGGIWITKTESDDINKLRNCNKVKDEKRFAPLISLRDEKQKQKHKNKRPYAKSDKIFTFFSSDFNLKRYILNAHYTTLCYVSYT